MATIAVLCAHEPKKDPRVEMVADSISRNHSVTIVAASACIAEEVVEPKFVIKKLDLHNHGTNFFKSPFLKFNWFCATALYSIKFAAGCFLLAKRILRYFFKNSMIGRKLKGYLHTLKRESASEINFTFAYRISSMIWLLLYLEKLYFVLFETLPSGIDCIYANDFETLMPAVAYKQRNKNCKIIYDCHEFYPYSHNYPPFWYSGILVLLERSLIKHVDTVITVNPLLAQVISKKYGVVVKDILNATPYFTRSIIEKPDVAPAKKDVNFLLQGSLRSQDGMEEFIAAWNEVDPSNAALFIRVINGPFKTAALNKVKHLATFNKSIFFIDPVSEDELIEAAMPFDVGIISYKPVDLNYKYCCPNKLNQYMHSGLAILANRTEFVATVVNGFEVGLVYEATNKADIKECIQRFIDNPTFLEQCKERAKDTARHRFNWQNEEKKLQEIIAGVV